MYKFIKIMHDILIECHGSYMEMKTVNYMLEIDIFRNSSQKIWGVLRGAFQGFGCPKRHPDALLAKTMLPLVTKRKCIQECLDILINIRYITLTKV